MMVYPHIDPVAFKFGFFTVHWYGLMYLIGLLGAWFLAKYRARQVATHWSQQSINDLLFYCTLGVVIGGRVGYMLFYNFNELIHHPLTLFKTWQGGMSFHGGLLGVCLALFIFARKHGLAFLAIGDFIAPLVPIGLGAGRLGNFINGELWGRPTDVAWAMIFPHVDAIPRHPSQLYQLAGEGFCLFIILWWYARRARACGSVSGLFLVGYAIVRFSLEFFRQPDWQIGYIAFGWLTEGQLLCIPMLLAGLALIGYTQTRQPRHYS